MDISIMPNPLSASDTESFAYSTVKDRLPVILTHVIDYLCREKLSIAAQYGEVSGDELKEVLARLSKLKNEIQTNKPLRLFTKLDPVPEYDDTDTWNSVVSECEGRWFSAPWLFVECYLYKSIHHSFMQTTRLKELDPFKVEKRSSLENCRDAATQLVQFIEPALDAAATCTQQQLWDAISNLVQLCVWGNQVDLSLSGGVAVGAPGVEHGNILSWVTVNKRNLLVDDTERACQLLRDKRDDGRYVALVLDNSGYELLADVCLSLLLLQAGVATKVRVYTKTRPWFVSDTTNADIDWLQQWISNESAALSMAWERARATGAFEVVQHAHWTTHAPFTTLHADCPQLYTQLKQAKLVIFKGDLNYRKLVNDLDWPPTTPFKDAIGPSLCALGPVLALRTVKGGPVVGATMEALDSANNTLGAQWNTSGQCGMVQMS